MTSSAYIEKIMQAEIVFLGSGTSMGVPTLGCRCPVCTSSDPRDVRTRPSVAILFRDAEKERCVLIDSGPDFRQQALREHITRVDAVLYTHAHADHILGLDDLRPLSFKDAKKIPLYADSTTAEVLRTIFNYTFSESSKYPNKARVALHPLEPHIRLFGADFVTVPLLHGELETNGFRFGAAAYLTDMSDIPEQSFFLLEDLDVLVLDALRRTPHPSHSNLETSLKFIQKIRPRRAYFTHMSHDLGHAETENELPPHVRLAYDGLRIPFEL
jgi:phosphoribosyl 1,2-cyclic phosphate phosphodiesterase